MASSWDGVTEFWRQREREKKKERERERKRERERERTAVKGLEHTVTKNQFKIKSVQTCNGSVVFLAVLTHVVS